MKLPKRVYSQLGPIPVVLSEGMVKREVDPSFGMWDEISRTVKIDPTANDAAQLQALFHEMLHVALTDSGANNNLTEAQAETFCDVGGTYLASAVLGGYLKFCEPR